jgi:Flagellar hook-length control protein FliK
MQNTAGLMATAPIDLLFGVVGQPPTRGPADAAQFTQLLNIFGLGQVGGAALPGVNSPPIEGLGLSPKSGVLACPEIPLFLGADLAQMIGLGTQIAPQPEGQTQPKDSEPIVSAKAQVLSVDGGNGEMLFLKIMPGFSDNAELPVQPGSDSNEEEMILPIRLRTVEQSGGRIIADGLLQTATGKDVSVRLNLDLAGQSNRMQLPSPDESGSAPLLFKAAGNGDVASLSKLLGQVDAKSLVIETVSEGPVQGLSVLPEASANIRRLVGPKANMSGRPAIPLGPQAAVIADAPVTVAPTVAGGSDPLLNQARPNIDGDNSKQQIENRNPNPDALIQTAQPDAIQPAVNQVNSIPSDISTTQLTTDAKGDLTQVRYFDLDLRLEQLKQNPGQRIRIQLMPSHLGKMELSIVNQRGFVTVNLTVDSPQAKQAVERNLAQLERQLTATGIRVDAFQLQVSQSAKSPTLAHQYQYFQDQHRHGGQPQQNGRGDHQYLPAQKQMSRFGSSNFSFAQAMVNCLA